MQDETGVDQSRMDDIAIRDDFSFVTVLKDDAKVIVHHFEKLAKKTGDRVLVSISKDK